MAGFVARQKLEQRHDIGIFGPLGDFGIEHAAGKFRRQRTDQEIDKFLAQILRQIFQPVVEGLRCA